MEKEDLNIKLYEKLYDEQQVFRGWLLSQPPEVIIQHSFEYAMREDIVACMEEGYLPDGEAQALLDSPSPLKEVFTTFKDNAPSYMDEIRDSLSSTAMSIIREQELKDKFPLYKQTAAYAREHGELDDYRASLQANVACKKAIEAAIAESYHDNRLDTFCVKPIMERFSSERVEYVLAATVQVKDWDERFSRSNKAWAATIPVVNDGNDIMGDRRTHLAVNKHSGLTDMFITAFREEQQKQREAPQRMSIYDQLRQPLPQTAAPTPKKNKTQER